MRLSCLLVAVLLAGCFQGGGGTAAAEATVEVDYNGMQPDPEATTLAFDPSSRPTAELYNASARPDAYTVHDLMVEWSEATGTRIEVEHHAAFGHRIVEIGGVVGHSTEGGTWHWQLFVDGDRTTAGMGTLAVEDGGQYTWRFDYSPR